MILVCIYFSFCSIPGLRLTQIPVDLKFPYDLKLHIRDPNFLGVAGFLCGDCSNGGHCGGGGGSHRGGSCGSALYRICGVRGAVDASGIVGVLFAGYSQDATKTAGNCRDQNEILGCQHYDLCVFNLQYVSLFHRVPYLYQFSGPTEIQIVLSVVTIFASAKIGNRR